MGCSEWAALSSREFNHYVDAWVERQKREKDRLESIDMMLAPIAYHTAIPYLEKNSQVKSDDFRVFREAPQADPEELREKKEFAELFNARLLKRAKQLNAAKRERKNNGKDDNRRPDLQRSRKHRRL